MSTIIVPISRYIGNKAKRLWNLGSLAKNLNLSVARQEVLKNKVIGLDSIKRKLLIIKKINDKSECSVIDLKGVQSCSVTKIYSSISAGSLKRKKLEEFLNTVSLCMKFKSGKKPLKLNFYHNKYNNLSELSILEEKAKSWAETVSNLLPDRIGKIA